MSAGGCLRKPSWSEQPFINTAPSLSLQACVDLKQVSVSFGTNSPLSFLLEERICASATRGGNDAFRHICGLAVTSIAQAASKRHSVPPVLKWIVLNKCAVDWQGNHILCNIRWATSWFSQQCSATKQNCHAVISFLDLDWCRIYFRFSFILIWYIF